MFMVRCVTPSHRVCVFGINQSIINQSFGDWISFTHDFLDPFCWEIRLKLTLYMDRVLPYTGYYLDTISEAENKILPAP